MRSDDPQITAGWDALVTAYESRRILAAKYAADMRHIALATIAAVEAGELELQTEEVIAFYRAAGVAATRDAHERAKLRRRRAG